MPNGIFVFWNKVYTGLVLVEYSKQSKLKLNLYIKKINKICYTINQNIMYFTKKQIYAVK